MTIRKKSLALILGLALVLGILSGCQSPGSDSTDPGSSGSGTGTDIDLDAITDICLTTAGIPAGTVMATVDGEEITAREVLHWVTSNADDLFDYFYYYGLDELPWDTELSGVTLREALKENALQMAVLYRLVDRHARADNLTVTQENMDDIQAALDRLETQLADKGGKELYMWLSLMDPELYSWYCQCEYQYAIMAEKYYGPDSGHYPSDQDVLDFLEEEGAYSCKHILLATMDLATRQPLSEEEAAAKKTQAESLLAQLRESEDPIALFDTLMHEYSEDTGLATNPDGYLAKPREMDSAFEEGALALEVGQISDIITGYYGYHIILRQPLDTALDIDPDQCWEDCIDSLMAQMRDGWMEQADVKTTQAFDDLDIAAFYNALQDVRIAYETKYGSES